MRENAPTNNPMARLSKRCFGPRQIKPCNDPSTIECRRFICQRGNRCMLDNPATPVERRPARP